MSSLTEQVIHFGAGQRLLGIFTQPLQPDPSKPIVVIPNSGVEHRVGPNRLHVHIARVLATRGYSTLRFDLGGLGDSDPLPGERPNANQDLSDALNMLEQRGLGQTFSLVGLCSGAHDAFIFALQETRVAGLFLIDSYAYPTPRFKRMRLWAKFSHPRRSWRNYWRRKIDPSTSEAIPLGIDLSWEPWPDQRTAAAGYTLLMNRGVHLAFVFTGDVQNEYMYADQHVEVFPFLKGHARVWHIPSMDHTLTRLSHRQRLIDLTADWLSGIAT